MEQFLKGKSTSVTIGGLQSLIDPLLAHWGDLDAFAKAGTPVFLEKAGLPEAQKDVATSFLKGAYRQVSRIRAIQFHTIWDAPALESAYTHLVPSTADSPIRQGCLWLSFRVHQAAIKLIQSEKGKLELMKFLKGVEENKPLFESLLDEKVKLSLDGVGNLLKTLAQKAVGEKEGPFPPSVYAGYTLERARFEGRTLPEQDLIQGNRTTPLEEIRLMASLIEPVHLADLKEAQTRFARLDAAEKTDRFTQLRKTLLKFIVKVAPYAPLGFEKFCQALESLMFPYPQELDWIRGYLKPIFTNSAQSTVFDNCMNRVSIDQRFEKLRAERSANVVMLLLARAMALSKASLSSKEKDTSMLTLGFLDDLDLQAEFNWPESLDSMLKGIAENSH